MKRAIILCCSILTSMSFNAQKFTKISEKKIDKDRLQIAEKFTKTYLDKCEKQDFTAIEGFNISTRMQNYLTENKMKYYCNKVLESGKIEILALEGVYLGPYSRNYDPQDLYVFKVKTEKESKIKYINVSVFRDQNYINGFLFSEIPTNKR